MFRSEKLGSYRQSKGKCDTRQACAPLLLQLLPNLRVHACLASSHILFAGHACTCDKASLASSGAELWPLQASRLVDEHDATDRAERRSGQCECECEC